MSALPFLHSLKLYIYSLASAFKTLYSLKSHAVVMCCTPGHLCPGCVVHHCSQFYGKIFWNKAIAQTNLKSDSTSDWTSEFKK